MHVRNIKNSVAFGTAQCRPADLGLYPQAHLFSPLVGAAAQRDVGISELGTGRRGIRQQCGSGLSLDLASSTRRRQMKAQRLLWGR